MGASLNDKSQRWLRSELQDKWKNSFPDTLFTWFCNYIRIYTHRHTLTNAFTTVAYILMCRQQETVNYCGCVVSAGALVLGFFFCTAQNWAETTTRRLKTYHIKRDGVGAGPGTGQIKLAAGNNKKCKIVGHALELVTAHPSQPGVWQVNFVNGLSKWLSSMVQWFQ